MLTEQGFATTFRVIGRDDAQGQVAADYMADHWANMKIAILNDGTTYGKGLADETKRRLNERGVREEIFQAYDPVKDDYSNEVDTLLKRSVSVLYLGGRHRAAALIARAAHERGYALQLVSGDSISTEEFVLIAGPAADGTLFTFGSDPRENAAAVSVVERFRAENFEPAGYTLLSYAAVQAWAQAVQSAGSLQTEAVTAALRGHDFDTVLSRIGFDQKGDLKLQSWVWYVWRGAEYVRLDQ
jgi:branched-chain amino acid transport system substrate-binding protein